MITLPKGFVSACNQMQFSASTQLAAGTSGGNCAMVMRLAANFGPEFRAVFHGFKNDTGTQNGETLIENAYTINSAVLEIYNEAGSAIESTIPGFGVGIVKPGTSLAVKFSGVTGAFAGRKARIVWCWSLATPATDKAYATRDLTASSGEGYETFTGAVTNRATVTDSVAIPVAKGVAAFAPIVLAEPVGPCCSVAVFGDSITDQEFYFSPQGPDKWGWVCQATSQSVLNLACSSAKVVESTQNNLAMLASRFKLLGSSQRVLVALGVNDVIFGRSFSEIAAAITKLVERLESEGREVWMATVMIPDNDSSDQFLSIASQTLATTPREAVRRDLNNWIRQKFAGRVVDFSAACTDSSVDGQKWKVPSAPVRTITLQANTNGSNNSTRLVFDNGPSQLKWAELNNAVVRFGANTTTVALRGLAFRIIGSNASGGSSIADLSSAMPAVPVAGDTVEVFETFTTDGLHPGIAGVKAIAEVARSSGLFMPT